MPWLTQRPPWFSAFVPLPWNDLLGGGMAAAATVAPAAISPTTHSVVMILRIAPPNRRWCQLVPEPAMRLGPGPLQRKSQVSSARAAPYTGPRERAGAANSV